MVADCISNFFWWLIQVTKKTKSKVTMMEGNFPLKHVSTTFKSRGITIPVFSCNFFFITTLFQQLHLYSKRRILEHRKTQNLWRKAKSGNSSILHLIVIFILFCFGKKKKKPSNFDWITNDIRAEKIISARIWAY